MTIRSREIQSNQQAIHSRLVETVLRHDNVPFRRVARERTKVLLGKTIRLQRELGLNGIVADLGCGCGHSTVNLAQRFPEFLVLGVDKSKQRIAKAKITVLEAGLQNAMIEREDIADFVLAAKELNISFAHVALYYPNPWPKKQHLQRRVYGHAVFPDLVNISQKIELRTNWDLFAEEFSVASCLLGKSIEHETLVLSDETSAATLFEKKYFLSGHKLKRVVVS